MFENPLNYTVSDIYQSLLIFIWENYEESVKFFILTFICGILIFTAGCNFDDLFLPYYDDEKLQMVYSIDK